MTAVKVIQFLSANQSTPLALASAVGQNKFVQRSKVF